MSKEEKVQTEGSTESDTLPKMRMDGAEVKACKEISISHTAKEKVTLSKKESENLSKTQTETEE